MSIFAQSIARLIRIASPGVVAILGLCICPGMAAAISGHRDADIAVAAMWLVAGPLHVVRNWLPGLGAARGPVTSTRRSRQGGTT
jgi:hypothetical protein